MATTSRLGSTMLSSAMLSKLSAPTSYRAFTTSIALRAGPSDRDAPTPPRMNPLVGNRRQPTEREPRARTPASPRPANSQPAAAASLEANLPPPPPPPESILANINLEPTKQHPYTASKTAKPFNLDIASIIANKSMAFGEDISSDPLNRPRVQAKAVTGRTVFVRSRTSPLSGQSPVAAIKILGRMVREQKVKNKYFSQKFHERPGLKKKRLKSQRWRSRFKTGFKAVVHRVVELKKQGW
ncbi:hypothetical protein B0J13DRAFT_609958 [Dactylonectria estremocensis]|uniref:Ribosomal protein S21 n=1 Tax=Dactylonectria estremocensis TaxID=1079267 RepID=A0A9P9IXW0_9HYPO|nr:hypothetical protein B0J13DRAFT_609958 [Dactylonectria estremocensis]